jgi:hypothetical protein
VPPKSYFGPHHGKPPLVPLYQTLYQLDGLGPKCVWLPVPRMPDQQLSCRVQGTTWSLR